MKTNRLNCVMVLAMFVMAIFLLSNSFAIPEFIENFPRVIPVSAQKDDLVKRADAEIKTSEKVFRLLQKSDDFVFEFNISQDEAGKSYALWIKDGLYKNYKMRDFLVFANGARIETMPAFSEAGIFFLISSGFLNEGKNEIILKGIDNKTPSIDMVEMFSLEDYEETHFKQVFTYPVDTTQPASHPDQAKYDVYHYDLTIALNMTSDIINATMIFTAVSLDSSLITVPLDFDDNASKMGVVSVKNNYTDAALPYTLNASENRLYVTYPSAIDSGTTFSIKIAYSGYPSSSGVFGPPYVVDTHGSSIPIVYTFSEPYGARMWFPCKDTPDDKAKYDGHITCPSAYFPVSNGKLMSSVDNGDGTKTFNYKESYPLATYLISIACTNYQSESAIYTALDGVTTMNVTHYLYPETVAAQGNAVNSTVVLIDFFADTFCEYPFLSEKYSNAHHNDTSSMEHQTCTSIRPDAFIASSGGGFARVNIHELSHQWFGDKITMNHFNHLWLNEGFATYCEALWTEHYSGTAAYHTYVNNWSTSDSYPIVSSSADNFSGSIVYRKGAWVLHMLRHVVGDTVFFQSLRNYITNPQYEYKTALSIDLENEFEKVAGYDLSWFFNEWLYVAVRPTYQWSWGYHQEGPSYILDFYVNQTQASTYTMPIDISVALQGGGSVIKTVFNNQKTQDFHIDLGSSLPTDVVFDPDNWILDNNTEVVTKPDKAVIKSVVHVPGYSNKALVKWYSNTDAYFAGYELYMSEDLTTWTLAANSSVLTKTSIQYEVSGLSPNKDYYFYMRAVPTVGIPGEFSNIYGCRLSASEPKILIVNGNDRWASQYATVYKGVYYHGKAVDFCGEAFDSCDNDVVGSEISLLNYEAVFYILGEESTTGETFSSAEQTLVTTYLNAGKCLFVSGAEIGWDLGRSGSSSTADIAFYNNYLKASYVNDASNATQAIGAASSIFSDIALYTYGTGSGDFYNIKYADRITPVNGSSVCMKYFDGTADTAGVQYSGTFKVVYFGFPFETIVEESARNNIMKNILAFFALNQSRIQGWYVF